MKHQFLDRLLIALFIAAHSPVLNVTAGGDLWAEAETAIKNLQSADFTLTNFSSNSVGCAVFPRVGKAGFILGSEHGNGIA